MAEFYWRQNVDQGCPFCGASVHERGFVDCIADTVVRNPEGQVSGVVDIYICASCAEQIARMVGSATQVETLEMAQTSIDLMEELEKTRDEVKAWNQRFDNLIKALTEGIDVSNIDLALTGSSAESVTTLLNEKGSSADPKKPRQGKNKLADSTK